MSDAQAIGAAQAGIGPAPAEQRLVSLDFIRGIAVLGIVFPNVIAFGQPFNAYFWPGAFLTPPRADDAALWLAQYVLVDGKMRGLFTLLFGAGLALFAERSAARGEGAGRQVRRLLLLLAFGYAHFLLLWRGDILTLYALCGLVALAFLSWSARRLLAAGLTVYALGIVWGAAGYLTPFLMADAGYRPELAGGGEAAVLRQWMAYAMADDRLEAPLMQAGSYGQFVLHNLAAHGFDPIERLAITGLETLPLMLIGMALYRLGLFGGRFDPVRQRRWGWAALAGGTAAMLALGLWVVGTGLSFWGGLAAFYALAAAPVLPMVLGLAALLAPLGARAAGSAAADRVIAAGRMAFSNYLGTSLIMVLVFHPWAGGLWGELDRPRLYGVAVLAVALMLAWSKPWLARFRMGPLEWLWRWLTYGRRPAFRK